MRPSPAPAVSRRHALALGTVGSLVAVARPVRADEAAAVAPPPPAEAATIAATPAGEPPIITELRARSVKNKAANDAERLASYYKRNADALRVLLDRGGARTLDPEIRAKIQKWLDENGV